MANSTCILIDFNSIVKPNNMARLISKIQPIPSTESKLGLLLVVPNTISNMLDQIPKGNGRIRFLNSQEFTDSIHGYAYSIYNANKKVCEIMGINGLALSQILDTITKNLPKNITIWIGISLDDPYRSSLIQNYLDVGFGNPYICKSSPLGYKFNDHGLCMIKQNNTDNNNVINDVIYVLDQFIDRKRSCTVNLKLKQECVDYFKPLCTSGNTTNFNGSVSQKEIAGTLYVTEVNADSVHVLDVNKKSVSSGKEEGVEVIDGLYNFHSHPLEAYKRHNVELGWPSAQDFAGFLAAVTMFKTVMHAVVTIEGIYFLSLTDHWASNMTDLNKAYQSIQNKFDLKTRNGYTIDWYINYVNSVPYNGFPIFNVKFLSWNDATNVIQVFYHKTGDNCFAREETLNSYKKLYS